MISEIHDPVTQAWLIGFISCLFSAFPLAMLLVIPHDGWGRHLPSNTYTKMEKEIRDLKKTLYESEIELKLMREVHKKD
jgi:hypothetical protein